MLGFVKDASHLHLAEKSMILFRWIVRLKKTPEMISLSIRRAAIAKSLVVSNNIAIAFENINYVPYLAGAVVVSILVLVAASWEFGQQVASPCN